MVFCNVSPPSFLCVFLQCEPAAALTFHDSYFVLGFVSILAAFRSLYAGRGSLRRGPGRVHCSLSSVLCAKAIHRWIMSVTDLILQDELPTGQRVEQRTEVKIIIYFFNLKL